MDAAHSLNNDLQESMNAFVADDAHEADLGGSYLVERLWRGHTFKVGNDSYSILTDFDEKVYEFVLNELEEEWSPLDNEKTLTNVLAEAEQREQLVSEMETDVFYHNEPRTDLLTRGSQVKWFRADPADLLAADESEEIPSVLEADLAAQYPNVALVHWEKREETRFDVHGEGSAHNEE